jgi:hypothetical protein
MRKSTIGAGALTAGTGLVAVLAQMSASGAGASATAAQPRATNGLVSQSQAIADGTLTMTTTDNPDGSITYRYNYSNGLVGTSTTPPPGFSPLTATDSQLAEYGFPLRPTDAASLAQWTTAMRTWRATPQPNMTVGYVSGNKSAIAATSFTGAGSSLDASAGSAKAAPIQGLNGTWTGYDNYAWSWSQYTGEEATYLAPNVGAACPGQAPTQVAGWTGLGGAYSSRFLQSGIVAGMNLGGRGPTVWQPFWEIMNSSIVWPPVLLEAGNTAIPIQPGDVVYSKTSYSSSNQDAVFYLEDETTGQTASFTLGNNGYSGNISNYYDGSTAESIFEEVSGDAGAFQQFAFTQVHSEVNGSWDILSSNPNTSLWTPYAAVGPIGSDGMSYAVGFNGC